MIKYEFLWTKISQMITFLMKDCQWKLFLSEGFLNVSIFHLQEMNPSHSVAALNHISFQCKGSLSCRWQLRYFSPC